MAKEKKLRLPDLKSLRKKYPDANLASVVNLPKEKILCLPSRNLSLNWQLGGGLFYGRICEGIGFESTGKSLMGLDFGSVCQALGGIVLWCDAEGTFANYWAEQNGVDPKKMEIYPDNDVEGFSDWARDMILYYRSILTHNEPILLVVDSIAAWECEENIDSDQKGGKAEMGNRAKAIYKMFRKRNRFFKKYGVCVYMINQVRDKLGVSLYELAETTPGGQATKFYASQRLTLIRSKQILYKKKKGPEIKIGQNIITRIMKNKVAPPRQSIKTEVYFLPDKSGYTGYSRYHGLPEIFEQERIITRQKSRYYFKDKMVANGEDKFLQVLIDNDQLRSKLIKRSSIMTLSKAKQKLADTKINLYPVKLRSTSDGEEE